MTKQFHYFRKELVVEIISMSKYYKNKNGTKILTLVNNVVIIFTMEIMHI
jgi:hypothetical protein